MALNMGAGAVCAIGDETTWGTPVADTYLLDMRSESLSLDITKIEAETLLAAKAAAGFDLMGMKASGGLSLYLRPEYAGKLIKWALGGTDTVVQNYGSVTGQHQHTIILATASGTLPAKTVTLNRKQTIKRYSGAKVSQIKISGKAGGYIEIELTLKAKDESTGTVATSTTPSLKLYKFVNATVTAGGTSLDATEFELTIDNSLADGIQTTGSGLYNTEPLHAARKIKIDIGMPYDANAETIRETNLKADTVLSSIVLHMESASIIASTSKYRADFTLNNCAVLAEPYNVGGVGLMTTKISAQATAVGATEPLSVAVYDATSSSY